VIEQEAHSSTSRGGSARRSTSTPDPRSGDAARRSASVPARLPLLDRDDNGGGAAVAGHGLRAGASPLDDPAELRLALGADRAKPGMDAASRHSGFGAVCAEV
jgi:hypothetical protein